MSELDNFTPVVTIRSMTTPLIRSFVLGASLLMFGVASRGETHIIVDHNNNADASPRFRFANVPPPSKNDAATTAKFSIVAGEADAPSGGLGKLSDGALASEEDQPDENFFFRAGSSGGRIVLDLRSVIEVERVSTYSWHPGTRGPQVYTLFASDGSAESFNAAPARDTDPEKCGWNRVASVDTRPKQGDSGGQYGVSVLDSGGVLGKFRYLLFDISRTEDADPSGTPSTVKSTSSTITPPTRPWRRSLPPRSPPEKSWI